MGFIELNLYRFLLLTNLGLRLIPILKKGDYISVFKCDHKIRTYSQINKKKRAYRTNAANVNPTVEFKKHG